MAKRGLLVVLSGPSGSGKGAVRAALLRRRNDAVYAVSATTRPKRAGEVDGVDYFFLSEDEFSQRIEQGALCEWADVYGHRYGTPRHDLDRLRAEGVVLLEKDVVGAQSLMTHFPEAVFVFLVPPSMAELRARLIGRGTDCGDAVRRRLDAAAFELAQMRHYDYLIVNDRLERTAGLLDAIIEAELCRTWRQPHIAALVER